MAVPVHGKQGRIGGRAYNAKNKNYFSLYLLFSTPVHFTFVTKYLYDVFDKNFF